MVVKTRTQNSIIPTRCADESQEGGRGLLVNMHYNWDYRMKTLSTIQYTKFIMSIQFLCHLSIKRADWKSKWILIERILHAMRNNLASRIVEKTKIIGSISAQSGRIMAYVPLWLHVCMRKCSNWILLLCAVCCALMRPLHFWRSLFFLFSPRSSCTPFEMLSCHVSCYTQFICIYTKYMCHLLDG